MNSFIYKNILTISSVALLAMAPGASAQDSGSDEGIVEEILVTATKRASTIAGCSVFD